LARAGLCASFDVFSWMLKTPNSLASLRTRTKSQTAPGQARSPRLSLAGRLRSPTNQINNKGTSTMMDLAEAAKWFSTDLPNEIEERNKDALRKACDLVRDEAKALIGTYDAGDWPQLLAATQRERERLGYPPNEPLLRSGELRDSIVSTILIEGHLGEIGSDDPVARWMEMGTGTVPPRSFLMTAYLRKEQEIADLFGDQLVLAWRH
jgi:hypothetical protein